jgi:hypothetical protein
MQSIIVQTQRNYGQCLKGMVNINVDRFCVIKWKRSRSGMKQGHPSLYASLHKKVCGQIDQYLRCLIFVSVITVNLELYFISLVLNNLIKYLPGSSGRKLSHLR